MNLAASPYFQSTSTITLCSTVECFSSTGKERDSETSYGYFGARYMDHELMTMWLSVDPMADKYPGISPYAYCAWNPVRLVDPDGREIGDYYSRSGAYLGWDGKLDNKVYILDDNDVPQNDNGIINPNSTAPLISTTYETLEAVVGVFERTKNNGGGYEESTAVIAGCSVIQGKEGYTDSYGKPHCEFPFLTEDQMSLGATSIHSHPFTKDYNIIEPSADDRALFGSCDINIIVGSNNPILNSIDNIGAVFYDSSAAKKLSMSMHSMGEIVNNRQCVANRHWGQILGGQK